jgi:hypothetical protein
MSWITVQDIMLTKDDKQTVRNGEMLQNQHINCAQRLISQQFPGANGLQLSLIQDKPIKYSQTAKAMHSNYPCQKEPLGCGSIPEIQNSPNL